MSIRVEFYGVVRRRAEIDHTLIEPHGDAVSLGDVLLELLERFPTLGDECLDGPMLRRGYLANVNGERFVSDPAAALRCGDTLLLLSSDAGG